MVSGNDVKLVLFDIRPYTIVETINFRVVEPCPIAFLTDVKHYESMFTQISSSQIDIAYGTLHQLTSSIDLAAPRTA